jgi:hypothetical protein
VDVELGWWVDVELGWWVDVVLGWWVDIVLGWGVEGGGVMGVGERACSMVGRWRVAEWSMESSSDCSAGGKKSTLGGASSTAGPGLAWCGALAPAARWR